VKALALDRAAALARPAGAAPPPALLAQRHSTLGGGSIAAPPIFTPGRPLEPSTRHDMEQGFGRDFGSIRVHDDARAHDNARTLGALAYAAGDDIVFAQGRYAPQTAAGRALIAHELAHSVQQGGVQMKADGPLPAAADARLEAEADGAALAITGGRPVPSLSRVQTPAIFRAGDPPPVAPAPPAADPVAAPAAAAPAVVPGDPAAPAATPAATPAAVPDTKPADPAPVPGCPPDVEVVEENPKGPGATFLIVSLPCLTLPRVKGPGTWVKQAYDTMASGNRLIFSPIFDGANFEAASSIKAFMEKPGEKYKDIWLQSWGFTNLQGMAKAIRDAALVQPDVKTVLDKPEVKKIVDGFALGKLTSAGCDIDHIVEKQIGGTSVPANLQLLVSDKNQESGRQTYAYMVSEVKRILQPNRTKVVQLQMRFKTAKVMDDISDGSFEVETLLRKGLVTGAADVKKKGEGSPLALIAGGAPEVINVKAAGTTPIGSSETRLIPGMKLLNYVRTAGSTATKGIDKIEAELASKPMLPGDKAITLSATVTAAPAAPAAPAADPAAAAVPAPAAAAPGAVAAGEWRKLTLDAPKNKDIPFYYPYLSKGKLTKLEVNAAGGLSGEGVISPTVKFFGDINFKFAPDSIEALASIPVEKLKTPGKAFFRFTESTLSLQLAPTLVPKGNVKFTVGPAAKPLMNGSVTVTVKDGVVIGTGELTPAGTIPGIKEAAGEIVYNSQTGWSGKLKATSASIPNSTVTAELGFSEKGGVLTPYGAGGISTKIRESELFLKVAWDGLSTSYWGGVTVPKPVPLVREVALKGSYIGGLLTLTGTAPIKWKSIDAEMSLTYKRKDNEEGKFSGSATVKVDLPPKASGSINLNFDEAGNYWGGGEISYQVTKDLRPKLGVELTKDRRVKVFGEVTVADIPLSKMWPAPNGARRTIVDGVGAKFNVPTPVAGITAYGEIKGSLGVGYGVGPVTLKGVKFTGELYPLEDDPQVKAQLTGKLSVPAYGELYGTFGAYIGLEVALGAVGVKGGIEVTPSLMIKGDAGIDFNAAYAEGGFSFSAEAYAKGALYAQLRVDFIAEIYAAWHLLSHKWTYPAANVSKQIGPELKVTLGKIAYSKEGGITWPDPSQIKFEPATIDPLQVVRGLLGEGKATEQ
jgi:hypothetical protein